MTDKATQDPRSTELPAVLRTERLDLRSLDGAALDALALGDKETMEARAGARFAEPFEPPPLVEEHLDFFRDRLRQPGRDGAWWFWLLVTRDGQDAVGMVGLPGEPDEEGRVAVGYSVYPRHQGRGYATEAVAAVVRWALRQPGVNVVRASVAPGNAASMRVATKVGMSAVGVGLDPDVGEVVRFELRAGVGY